MNIVLALSLFVLEASVLGSPLKHLNTRRIKYGPDKDRIVGGVEVIPHSVPHQVALVLNSAMFCGGVLISTQYVLTVAHCTYGMDSITVILGAHNFRCNEDSQIIIYNPTVINHANYTNKGFENDISLIKLNQNIPPTSAIRAVQLLAPKNAESFEGYTGKISGWGFTSSSGNIQSNLRKALVEIISNNQCQVSSTYGSPITYAFMCTLGIDDLIGSVGGCSGDSGGPLVVGDNELVGLVAFGDDSCEVGSPTVYTRISSYREWITTHSGV